MIIAVEMTPTDYINGSVLMFFCQIHIYAGSLLGVRFYIKNLMEDQNKTPHK